MKLLEAENLSVSYGDIKILDGLSFSVEPGDWLMLIGPNGAGKSTVINAVSQGVSYKGSIRCLEKDVRSFKPNMLAKHIGVLAQNHAAGYSFTVGEVVRLGRYAYSPDVFSQKTDEDEKRVLEALELTGLLSKIDRSVSTLSGGELQRVFLSQLLAQNPQVLLLDEPTNHLDLIYQRQIFTLLSDWLRGRNDRAIVSVVHDLSLARAYGTSALLLCEGKTLAQGAIEDVFTEDNLRRAYSMDVYEWMSVMLRQWQPRERI